MDADIVFSIILIAVLLAGSAFFAASETALTAVSRGKMHQMEKDGSRAARHVNALVGNREKLIGAVLLGNTFINILSSSLATSLLERHMGKQAVLVATGLMTVAILIFAEVLPKTIAIVRTERTALLVGPPLRAIVAFLAPIVSAVQFLVWRFLWVFSVRPEQNETVEAHEEIRGTVDLHHLEGTMEREHRDMIAGVLDLRDLTVADVMIHRKSVNSVDAGLPPDEIIAAAMAVPHTRVPLWRGEPENIVGILHMRDVARAFMQADGDIRSIDVIALASEPWFVPDTTSLEEQLAAFRERRTHFAFVVDEYGVLQGLVTLEDILEEIFGTMADEPSPSRPDIRRRPDGTYLVDGGVSVREINRTLDWKLPEDDATTVAGLVIHQARTIPDAGQRFAFFGYTFEILRRQRNQITALRVTPPKKPDTNA